MAPKCQMDTRKARRFTSKSKSQSLAHEPQHGRSISAWSTSSESLPGRGSGPWPRSPGARTRRAFLSRRSCRAQTAWRYRRDQARRRRNSRPEGKPGRGDRRESPSMAGNPRTDGDEKLAGYAAVRIRRGPTESSTRRSDATKSRCSRSGRKDVYGRRLSQRARKNVREMKRFRTARSRYVPARKTIRHDEVSSVVPFIRQQREVGAMPAVS